VRPPFCDRCGLPYDGEIDVAFECSNCRDLELDFRFARSAIAAKGAGLELVHRYKYHRALWFEPLFEQLLHEYAAPKIRSTEWDWIVPVPLHPVKEREREFNQAARIAHLLSRATGIPVAEGTLRRVHHTPTQTTLGRRARSQNVHGAFEPGRPFPRPRPRVLLVDDVLTTGATTNACARILRRRGATDVGVWTLARGL
jgi:ComF family protein